MARKQSKVSGQMLFIWFMLAALILLLAPHNLTNKFRLTFAHIFRWPLRLGRSISLSAGIQQQPTDTFRRKESQYQNHIAFLEEKLRRERQEKERLSGLRDRFGWEGVNFEPADIINISISGARNKLIINRGRSDGLKKGQFVLGDNSIIGTICELSSHTAQVKLITDSESNIAANIAGLKTGVWVRGNSNNTAKIRLLPTRYKIKTGDKVYAAKTLHLPDAAIIIGTVDKCKIDDKEPLLWDITVKPACNIEKLTCVDVIVMNPKE